MFGFFGGFFYLLLNLLSIRENGGILSPVQDYQSFLRGNFCIKKQKNYSLIHRHILGCISSYGYRVSIYSSVHHSDKVVFPGSI